jgi:hypothetical protein
MGHYRIYWVNRLGHPAVRRSLALSIAARGILYAGSIQAGMDLYVRSWMACIEVLVYPPIRLGQWMESQGMHALLVACHEIFEAVLYLYNRFNVTTIQLPP